MIRVCSLDYLNKENFPSDIMSADGKILVTSGQKITSGVLLKLFFREIYINELVELEASKSVDTEGVFENEKVGVSKVRSASPDALFGEVATSDVIDFSSKNEEEIIETSEESLTEEALIVEETVEEETLLEDEDSTDVDENVKKYAESVINSKSSLPPKGTSKRDSQPIELKEAEIIEEDPEKKLLVFDEKMAESIAKNSVKLGEILKYSKNELSDLEKAGYYCNIGVTKFTVGESKKRGFRKAKALKSYDIILNEKCLSEAIAEAVKFSVNPYDSDTFVLNAKIPSHHVIAITSYYEELLCNSNSKEKVLLKMLQMGGNKFNIFVLHKFINMMREIND